MKRKALFVGINDYEGGLTPLACACNDATNLCDYFRDELGYDAHVLRNVDILTIRKKISKLTEDLQKGDVFLFFFAGHGFTVDKGNGNDRRLATASDLKDHLEEGEGGISLRRLRRLTKGGYSRIFILDACQTKIDATGKTRAVDNIEMEKFRERDLSIISSIVATKTNADDIAPLLVINSCNVGDVAYELEDNGLFTWAFLGTLEQLKKNGETAVFNADLVAHIAAQMRGYPGGFRQTPAFFASDETMPEINVFHKTEQKIGAQIDTPALVKCPVCGRWRNKVETFDCRECGRENICVDHQDSKIFLCADCTAKKAREDAERQASDVRTNTRRAIEESNNGNYGKAYEFAQKADLNNAAIQGIIGYALVNGIGCDRDVQRGIDWWLKAAMQGSAPCQYNLGVLYFEGKDVGQDDLEAVKWFKKAAENGYAPAQWNLSCCYAYARGVSKSESETIMWCRKAAEKGFVPAQYNMGALYYNGCKAIAKDEAQKWLRMAAGKGNSEASKLLGLIEEDVNDVQGIYEQAENYYRGQNGVKEDRAKAFELYKKAAEGGNADAQYSLGYMYAYGECVAKDEEKALFWYRKAAAQGHEKAGRMVKGLAERIKSSNSNGLRFTAQQRQVSSDEAYEKGKNYYYGRNCFAQSFVDAVGCFRLAAELGHAWAQCYLGTCYMRGEGVNRDEKEAAKWYRRAADAGNDAAQCYIANCYMKGDGVSKNEEEAVKWYRKAANEGNATAQCNLGHCYYLGKGVALDYIEAVRWYRRAVAKGNAIAQNSLGLCYENGQGVPQDYSEAANLYRNAIANGNERAKESLERVEQTLERMKRKAIGVSVKGSRPDTSSKGNCGDMKYVVVLQNYGNNKIAVIREIISITGMGLAEAKQLVESAPVTIVRGVVMSECKRIAQQLEKAGARVYYAEASLSAKTLGHTLRDARLTKGYSIEQVATKTRMPPKIVKELEDDDFHSILTPIYGRGFVRLYAECVGLDPEPLTRMFMEAFGVKWS